MMDLRVVPDLEALVSAAAEVISAAAVQAVQQSGRFALALSGGHTPQPLHRLLATPAWRDRVPWERTRVFWGDERCVPFDDDRNNASHAIDDLLAHVPVGQVHRIDTVRDPADAAARYEETLRDTLGEPPCLDLVLLGIGDDGHTASLFPGSPLLDEDARWVATAPPPRADEVARVTLTIPALGAARRLVFLVSGEVKAGVLRAVQDGTDLPAARVANAARSTLWLADAAAASCCRRR